MIRPDELAALTDLTQVCVLVFADSHGSDDFILRTAAQYPQADLAIHLGDHTSQLSAMAKNLPFPLIGVAGNCDGWAGRHLPQQQLLVLAGYRIFITHGHLYGVKQQLETLLAAGAGEPNRADAILFGHTHRLLERTQFYAGREVRLFNPGSCRPGSSDHTASALMLQIGSDGIIADFLLDLP